MSNTLIATVGIDLGKSTFHLVGFDEHGAIRLRQKMSRSQLERRFANLRPCLVGMEACAGAHHVARRLAAYGHDARLIPAKYVKPFLKGHKNDYRDAEAIAEAVGRPTMSFVPLKSVETRRIHVDKGYRGHNHPHRFRVWISGQVRRVTASIRREMRRRAAVEPVIGHLKAEHRMGRNYLKGPEGDRINAVLAAAGYNSPGEF